MRGVAGTAKLEIVIWAFVSSRVGGEEAREDNGSDGALKCRLHHLPDGELVCVTLLTSPETVGHRCESVGLRGVWLGEGCDRNAPPAMVFFECLRSIMPC